MKTAVEWLEDCLTEQYPNGKFVWNTRADIEALFKRAKEMEKEQGYSEEEVIELLQKALTHKDDGETGSLVTAQGEIRPANFYSWFEQFKNK
jgi:hypothetical protein